MATSAGASSLPPKDLVLWADATICDGGQRDPVFSSADRSPFEALPKETFVYLLASRYCEIDRLSQRDGQHAAPWRSHLKIGPHWCSHPSGRQCEEGPPSSDLVQRQPGVQLARLFFPHGITIGELVDLRSQQHGEPDQFLHYVDDPVVVGRGFHAAVLEFLKAAGTLDWFGIVNMRIHRPRSRRVFTELKLCDPPDTCITASVRPWVGRLAPMLNGYVKDGLGRVDIQRRAMAAPARWIMAPKLTSVLS